MVYVTAPVMSVCRKYLQKSGWYREISDLVPLWGGVFFCEQRARQPCLHGYLATAATECVARSDWRKEEYHRRGKRTVPIRDGESGYHEENGRVSGGRGMSIARRDTPMHEISGDRSRLPRPAFQEAAWKIFRLGGTDYSA